MYKLINVNTCGWTSRIHDKISRALGSSNKDLMAYILVLILWCGSSSHTIILAVYFLKADLTDHVLLQWFFFSSGLHRPCRRMENSLLVNCNSLTDGDVSAAIINSTARVTMIRKRSFSSPLLGSRNTGGEFVWKLAKLDDRDPWSLCSLDVVRTGRIF